jgi:LysM repeat protein
MSERIKLTLLSALLLLALVFSVLTTANTIQAVRNLQLQNHDVKAGKVTTIRAWMTVPAISRIYHIPEDYVYRTLEISSPVSYHHVTLYEIANRKHQPVDQIIHTLQHAIVIYRQQHPGITIPSRVHHSSKNHLAPILGRAEP